MPDVLSPWSWRVPTKRPFMIMNSLTKTQTTPTPTLEGRASNQEGGTAVAVPSTLAGPTNSAGSSTPAKSVRPSLLAYRERRAAQRILTKLASTPEEDLSDKEKDSKAWALKILKEKEENSKRIAASSAAQSISAGKRQGSIQETPPPAKKSREGPSPRLNRPLSKVLKDHLVWAVIDANHAEGAITASNWKLVEKAMIKCFKEVLADNPGPAPCCRDAGWQGRGVKLMACGDTRSTDLLKAAIQRVGEVWPGARLNVVERDKIPCRPRARAWIPDEPADPKEILEILQLSNPELDTQDWRVAKVEEPVNGSRQILVVINAKSTEAILQANGIINYAFSSINLKLYKKDVRQVMEESKASNVATGADGNLKVAVGTGHSPRGKSDVSDTTNFMTELENNCIVISDDEDWDGAVGHFEGNVYNESLLSASMPLIWSEQGEFQMNTIAQTINLSNSEQHW